MTEKEKNVQKLFDEYMAEIAREEEIKAKLEEVVQAKDDIVRQIFEITGDKIPYMHPKLGSVIPIARKRGDGKSTHYFRRVRAKAVQVGGAGD